MKITKFVHSCLLVEMPEPINRTALFDPGTMSEEVLHIEKLQFLDDIIITHSHMDHLSVRLIKKLTAKFPNVRITSTQEVVDILSKENILATAESSSGIDFFIAPHENGLPLFDTRAENVGIHYLDILSHPGDSHNFQESRQVLALPVTAPWGSTVKAVTLALELKPKFVIPIHDWHWSEQARAMTYNLLEQTFLKHDITFIKMQTAEPIVLNIAVNSGAGKERDDG